MRDKFYELAFHSDLHATRIILAISEFIWGVALLFPGETFSRSRTYHGMDYVAPEEAWGIVWLCSACLQFAIVYKREYHSRTAVWFAGFNALLWWSVVASLYVCVWPINAVASGDCALAIAATWVWVCSGWTPKPFRGCEQWM